MYIHPYLEINVKSYPGFNVAISRSMACSKLTRSQKCENKNIFFYFEKNVLANYNAAKFKSRRIGSRFEDTLHLSVVGREYIHMYNVYICTYLCMYFLALKHARLFFVPQVFKLCHAKP
jgi:hypothetical protein